MYRLLLFAALACLAAQPAIMAQPMKNPATILAEADSARQQMRTATYTCKLSRNLSGEMWVQNIGVSVVRLGSENEVGFKVRFDLAGGAITYDGERTRTLNHTTRKVEEMHHSFSFLETMDGNAYGRTVNIPFRRSNSFSSLSEDAKYEGITLIEGVECHTINVPYADGPEVTGFAERYYFSTGDHILRRRESWGNFLGVPRTDTATIINLKMNQPIPDSVFTIEPPEGYEFSIAQPYIKQPILANGTAAPDWTLPNAAGETISLAALKGKVVVLDFWYIACPPCLRVMPKLQKLHEEFGGKDVIFIGININDSAGRGTSFARSKGVTYDLVFNGRPAAAAYKVSAYPTMYVIGRDGTILYGDEGDKEEMEADLRNAIRKALKSN